MVVTRCRQVAAILDQTKRSTSEKPPPERQVWACLGWCDLTIEGGKLTGITPGAIPEPEPAPEPEPTAQEDNDAMLVDHEYRLTLMELGVTSDAV